MTDSLRAGPVTMRNGVAIVFDDESRVRWSRSSGDAWTLAEHWPNPEELASINRHLESGGRMLVITHGHPITTYALASELPTPDRTSSGSEVVEITLSHFDWLPEDVRARGENFLRDQFERWSIVPPLLRPPVILDQPEGSSATSQVTFALLAPETTRSKLEWGSIEYLTRLVGARPLSPQATA